MIASFKERFYRAWAVLHLVYISCKALLGRYCKLSRGVREDTHEPRIYRTYVFNEGTEEPGFSRELGMYSMYAVTRPNWETEIRELTGWTSFRVEARYVFRHKKYRMILRPGDASPFPMYTEPSAPACRLPKGVLSARLQGPAGSDIDCDVTKRVFKYQGPRGDFHSGLGLVVKIRDMFPFDDHADNAARFSHLRIIDTCARIRDIPYDDNALVTLKVS